MRWYRYCKKLNDHYNDARHFRQNDTSIWNRSICYRWNRKTLFSAMSWAKGDPFLLLKSLMIQLVLVDEKHVTEDYIDNLSMRDVIMLTNVIQSMLTDTNK